MVAVFEREGVGVNAKRVRRLMRMMGLEVHLSQAAFEPGGQRCPGISLNCYAIWLSSGSTKSGRSILPTSGYAVALGIWPPLSTGLADMCWPGSCPIPWK